MNLLLEMIASAMNITKVSKDEVYNRLEQQDLGFRLQPQGVGASKIWLASFMQGNLPKNRLRANEDDLSAKFESIDCGLRRKKKKGKSKANVPGHRPLTRLQKRKFRQHFWHPSNNKYSTYVPLKDMWTSYIEELIQFDNLTESGLPAAGQKMMKADFHGCPLTVQKSKCPSYIGVHGIVVKESKNIFQIVTPDDTIKCIPKTNSIFSTVLQDHVFTIHGNQFTVKPGERAGKKFKAKPTIDL